MYFEIEELPHFKKWRRTVGESESFSFVFILDALDMEYLSNLLKGLGF